MAHAVRVRGTRFAHVDVADRFACECASVDVLELWPEVAHELGNGKADALLDRQAVNVGQRLIDPNDPQVAIDQLDTDRGSRLDTPQEVDRLRGLPLRAAQSELQLLLVFAVGRGANPQVDLTGSIAKGNGAEGMPSEDPVEAANPVLQ